VDFEIDISKTIIETDRLILPVKKSEETGVNRDSQFLFGF
jgi:hypothetical protein